MLSIARQPVAALYVRVREEQGQTFVEYALLLAVVALIAALGAAFVGNSVSSLFSSVAGMV
jgi:Flp pilus assembly pilin Flp